MEEIFSEMVAVLGNGIGRKCKEDRKLHACGRTLYFKFYYYNTYENDYMAHMPRNYC